VRWSSSPTIRPLSPSASIARAATHAPPFILNSEFDYSCAVEHSAGDRENAQRAASCAHSKSKLIRRSSRSWDERIWLRRSTRGQWNPHAPPPRHRRGDSCKRSPSGSSSREGSASTMPMTLMGRVTAARLPRHLEASGFVLIKKPPAAQPSAGGYGPSPGISVLVHLVGSPNPFGLLTPPTAYLSSSSGMASPSWY
jgi:hypothetical protein